MKKPYPQDRKNSEEAQQKTVERTAQPGGDPVRDEDKGGLGFARNRPRWRASIWEAWREDHLFSLERALKVYDGLQERIVDYDRKILAKLEEMTREEWRGEQAPNLQKEKARGSKRSGEEPLRQALYG